METLELPAFSGRFLATASESGTVEILVEIDHPPSPAVEPGWPRCSRLAPLSAC